MKISKAIVSTMIIGTCLTACGNQQKKNNQKWIKHLKHTLC